MRKLTVAIPCLKSARAQVRLLARWEREQAEWNLAHGGYDTELWRCEEELASVSSTRVREALAAGDVDEARKLLDPKVYEYVTSRLSGR